MRKIGSTYQWLFYAIFALVFLACASAEMEEEAYAEDQMAQEENANAAAMEESEMDTESSSESAKKELSLDVKQWKNKAKQQLESIEDLLLILQDSTLDSDFKIEIEKELNDLYSPIKDSTLYNLFSEDLKFKKFKELKVEEGDTMSLLFKNHKDLLRAEFIVVQETKQFGDITEVVESLKILSIKEEE